ncbi:hypothetical protein Tco_1191819, partial [Tanacetum coccineum]
MDILRVYSALARQVGWLSVVSYLDISGIGRHLDYSIIIGSLEALPGLSQSRGGHAKHEILGSILQFGYNQHPFLVEDGLKHGSPVIDGTTKYQPEDPYAIIMAANGSPLPDYIPGPEVPPSPGLSHTCPEEAAVTSPLTLPECVQPLLVAASPTTNSPGYVPESDPEEEPEEDDEDPEEDPTDYPADMDDDDDDDEDRDSISHITIPSHHPIALLFLRILDSCLGFGRGFGFSSTTPSHVVAGNCRVSADRCLLGRLHAPLAIARRQPLIHISEGGPLWIFVDMVVCPPRCAILGVRCMTLRRCMGCSRCYVITYYGSGAECIDFRVTVIRSQETKGDFRVIGIRPQETGSVDYNIEVAKRTTDIDGRVSEAAWTRKSLLSIMGYSQLADCIDLLFCLATQYRSFVQKMEPKRRTTRLNLSATPTPVTDTHTTTSVTNAQIQAMINEGITAALAARDATRNGDDSHTSGTGVRRPVQVARECTYPDFLKCQPLNFKGTEGVVGLTQWFEKMESVYSISNCTVACQVKFATCTLQGNALTWWNSHVKTTTPEAAHVGYWMLR